MRCLVSPRQHHTMCFVCNGAGGNLDDETYGSRSLVVLAKFTGLMRTARDRDSCIKSMIDSAYLMFDSRRVTKSAKRGGRLC